MRTKYNRALHRLVVSCVALLAACGEGPVAQTEEIEVHGLIIEDGGTPVVTVDDGVVTGSIAVPNGDETPNYDFVFTDHNGDPIVSGLGDFELSGTVANTDVAIFHSESPFQAHFQGLSAGTTTVVIELIHSLDGDAHFESPDITVEVS